MTLFGWLRHVRIRSPAARRGALPGYLRTFKGQFKAVSCAEFSIAPEQLSNV
jgi:hypothetical protein